MHISRFLTLLLAASILSACASNRSSDVYTANSSGGKVIKGTLISSRPVTIKENDKVQDNVLGGAAGGVGGAVVGSTIGGGSGSSVAAVGGAILGAVAGAFVQDSLSSSQGMEYIVQIDSDHARSADTKTKKEVRVSSKGGIEESVSDSIETEMETELLSVVQAPDPNLINGNKVFVVYHDDRPRVVPAAN